MRLPGRTEGAVQELHTVDPGVYAARGEAVGRFGEAVADISKEWYDRQVEQRTAQAIVDYSNEMTRFETRFGNQRSFTRDEVNELGVDLPDEDKWDWWTDSSGVTHRTPKEEYNAEDIYPVALKKKMEGEIQLRARSIPGSANRKRFLANEQQTINKRYQQAESQAHTQREAKILTQYELNIENAETAGNYPVAVQLVRNHPLLSQEEKDQEILRLIKAEETRYLTSVRRNGNDADIRREINRLTLGKLDDTGAETTEGGNIPYGQDAQGDFRNSYTLPEREREIDKLRAELKAREADRGDNKKINLARYYNDFYDALDDPETTRSDMLSMVDDGLRRGILEDGDITRLRKAINEGKGGGAVETRTADQTLSFLEYDDLALGELQQMDRDGDLDRLLGIITPEQLKHLKEKSKDGVSHPSEWKENVDYAEAQLGVVLPKGASDKEKRVYAQQQAAVREMLYAAFRRFADTNNGAPPDAQQRQDITDRLLRTEVREEYRTWFGYGEKRYRNTSVELDIEDIPYSEWAKYTEVLNTFSELPPTAQDYQAVQTLVDDLDKFGLENPTAAQLIEATRVVEAGESLATWAKKQRTVR